MNKTDISHEKIVGAAIEILQKGDIASLSMRNVAQACGVAVGSIYNYFPTKSELIIAVIAEVWGRVFPEEIYKVQPGRRFSEFVSEMYGQVYLLQKDYQNFFMLHKTLIDSDGKMQARQVMAQYFSRVKSVMLETLAADNYIEDTMWTWHFNQKAFVDFVFENILSLLARGKENCDFFVLLLNRMLY